MIRHLDTKHTQNENIRCNICGLKVNNQFQLRRHIQEYHNGAKEAKPICSFWLKRQCQYDQFSCRFSHTEAQPPKCRNKNRCPFLPNCKFGHDQDILCRYQERCLNERCVYTHLNEHFLGEVQKTPAPDLKSYQTFPQVPHQMWRPWW